MNKRKPKKTRHQGSDTDLTWKTLRVGDRVRILLPPHVRGMPRETRALYNRLIRKKIIREVVELDKRGVPWIQYFRSRKKGKREHHFLALNHASLKIISRV